MSRALEVFFARIEELEADIAFVAVSSALRPRLSEIINWQGSPEVVNLARKFVAAKDARPENVYAALLVRMLAEFERYLRKLVGSAVERTNTRAKLFEEISEILRVRHILLTGRALSSIGSPREHVVFNYDELAANLASCKAGNSEFRLNSAAFSAVVTGASPAVLEQALSNLDGSDWWDAVGRAAPLQKVLGTKKTRETGERAKERLKELWRWRNHVAHGGDKDIVLSEASISDAVEFIRTFATSLDREVDARFSN